MAEKCSTGNVSSITKRVFDVVLIKINIFRLPAPSLPTYQDCHELWSKRRRREMREAAQNCVTQKSQPPPPVKLDLGPT